MKAKTLFTFSAISIVLTLPGCAVQGGMFGPGKFEIVQADTRFDPNGNTVILSKNNRISSKSIAGGVHIDGTGVFINPSVTKSKTGQVAMLSLNITNLTSHDSAWGSPNSLGVPESISFLVDGGRPIQLKIMAGDKEWSDAISYNSVTKSASSNITESGIVPLSIEQYKEIMSAQSLAVQIIGSKRSVTYEASDISKDFQKNLQDFYQKNL